LRLSLKRLLQRLRLFGFDGKCSNIVEPLQKRLVFADYFAPSCVFLLDLRQQACVVILARHKISSQILRRFSSGLTIFKFRS
jgi:hypothetical protein